MIKPNKFYQISIYTDKPICYVTKDMSKSKFLNLDIKWYKPEIGKWKYDEELTDILWRCASCLDSVFSDSDIDEVDYEKIRHLIERSPIN